MKENEVARAYSRALLALGEEAKVDVAKELTTLTEAINSSNDLENVLFLDAFTEEEKRAVLQSVLEKLKTSTLTKNFFSFLCQEKRLGLFPLIFKEVIVIDDHNKGFIKGTIEGREEKVDDREKEKLTSYMEQRLGKKVRLDYKCSEDITSGYRVNVKDLLLDVSVDGQLEQFKKSVLSKSV